MIFNSHDFDSHEQVHFYYDKKTGLKAIIAIHNTNRGPALGGCRFWLYDCEEDALKDVLRLSQGMTYKAAMANLQLGGGKAVIIGDPKKEKSVERLHAFARIVNNLNGRYITAADMGTSLHDVNIISEKTQYVVGRSIEQGGSGDHSILTSLGVFCGIKACVSYNMGKSNLKGIKVAVQGLGHVGMDLITRLHLEGAQLIVSDLNDVLVNRAVQEFGAQAFEVDKIYSADADIFSPCALGSILNDETIPMLNCKIIAGSANNQLAEPYHGDVLEKRNILYAPDYIINAGGLINVSYEGSSYSLEKVQTHIERIYDTLLETFAFSEKRGLPKNRASDIIARERFLEKRQY